MLIHGGIVWNRPPFRHLMWQTVPPGTMFLFLCSCIHITYQRARDGAFTSGCSPSVDVSVCAAAPCHMHPPQAYSCRLWSRWASCCLEVHSYVQLSSQGAFPSPLCGHEVEKQREKHWERMTANIWVRRKNDMIIIELKCSAKLSSVW